MMVKNESGNLSQIESSFPLELLSGTAFIYSQPNANPDAEHQNICSQKQDAVFQTVPQIVAANAETTNALDTLSFPTEESGFEISDYPCITVDSQNAPLNQIVHSDLIIDASSLSNDILNLPSICIVNAKDSSSNKEISTWISDLSRADVEIIDLYDSDQTFVANDNLKSEPECGNEQPEQARHVNLPSPEFYLNEAHILSGTSQEENCICCYKDGDDVKLKNTEIQTLVSESYNSDIISETQYRVPGNVLNQGATNRIQRILNSYRKHCVQSNSCLSYKYSGRASFSMKPAKGSKQTTLDDYFNRSQEVEIQTNMNQKEPGKLLCEKIVQVPQEIRTNAELSEITNSSISTTEVIDEKLTKVVTEHCGSHNKQNSNSDSENEESNANRSWLKAYLNEAKDQIKDLKEKFEHEHDQIGKNLREMFILQDDSSKDEELQEMWRKFYPCAWLAE